MTSCQPTGLRVPLEVIVRVIRLSLPAVAFPSVERNDLLRTYSLVSSELWTVAQKELFTHVTLFSENQAWRFLRALDPDPRAKALLANIRKVTINLDTEHFPSIGGSDWWSHVREKLADTLSASNHLEEY